MKLAQMKIGQTFICGRPSSVEDGTGGVEVIILAVGKYMSVPQPCGRKIVEAPADIDMAKKVVVAVRQKHAQFATGQYGSYWYRPAATTPQDEWVAVITTATRIRMTKREYELRNGARQELEDMLEIANDKYQAVVAKERAARNALIEKVIPESGVRGGYNGTTTYHLSDVLRYNVTPTVSFDDYVEAVISPAKKGLKTKITAYEKAKEATREAKKEYDRVATCARNAGVN